MDVRADSEGNRSTQDLVDQVYEQLLNWLVGQGLLVSQELNVASLAQELGVSRTPVTLALVRLECDGLVRKTKDTGWVTVQIGLEDLYELVEVRRELDVLTAQRAAERVTPESADQLLAIVVELEVAAKANDPERWREADRRFHACVLDMVGNERLTEAQEWVNRQLARIEVSSLVLMQRMADSYVEHREIAEAIVKGQPDLAGDRSLRHTLAHERSLVDMMQNVVRPLLHQNSEACLKQVLRRGDGG